MPHSTKNHVLEFSQFLAGKALRHSSRREEVARIFFSIRGHVSIEDLYARVHQINPAIGIATVYRTLGLLVESGLVARRQFAGGGSTYEKVDGGHHDHLICTGCNEIVEFHHDQVEKLQETIASKYGYRLTSHKMELYGLCRKCEPSKHRKEKK